MSVGLENSYNILSIDDNENNLYTLTALLKTLDNINVIECISAKDGLDALIKQKIDLILLDIQMPVMNGFEAARLIKSNKKTKDIPIIFVTAVFKSEEFIKEGFEIGAIDYITKPIDDNQLLNKISLYLKIFDQKNKLSQSEKKFYDIAQSIGDGIYTVDTDFKATFINKNALSMLGYQSSELLNKDIHQYIHYKNINNTPINTQECSLHKAMMDGQSVNILDEYFVKKEGGFLPVSITITPLYTDNKVVGSVVIFRDKTKEEKIIDLEKEKIENQEQVIWSMINLIESRDSYTAGHTKRVARYCELIAKEMGYSDDEIRRLIKAAWLHDIGKISTPDSILLKPGKLNSLEYKLIQEHLNIGYEMLSKIDMYKEIATIIRQHHEKYDGSGYPRGLKGENINNLSRIMIVADAFDAMTTNRIYKSKKSVQTALDELESLSGKHFHPEVVDAALNVLKGIEIDSEISQLPSSPIEQERFSYFYKDRLTNLYIVDYLSLVLRYHFESKSAYLYSIKLLNFSAYNKEFGWSKGDKFLVEFANFLKELYSNTAVFRVEGDDFLILSQKEQKTIDEDINSYVDTKDSEVGFSLSETFVEDIHNEDIDIFELI